MLDILALSLLNPLTLRRKDRVGKGGGGGRISLVRELRAFRVEIQVESVAVVVRHLFGVGSPVPTELVRVQENVGSQLPFVCSPSAHRSL